MASTPTTAGSVLGAAVLPATTAGSVLFAKLTNVPVLVAFLVVNLIVLFVTISGISRFAINRFRKD